MSKGLLFWRGAESHSIYTFKCALDRVNRHKPQLWNRTLAPAPFVSSEVFSHETESSVKFISQRTNQHKKKS